VLDSNSQHKYQRGNKLARSARSENKRLKPEQRDNFSGGCLWKSKSREKASPMAKNVFLLTASVLCSI